MNVIFRQATNKCYKKLLDNKIFMEKLYNKYSLIPQNKAPIISALIKIVEYSRPFSINNEKLSFE